MAIIKINTKKTGIPVEIGDLKFEFDLSDENIIKFQNADTELRKELDALDEEKEDFVTDGKIVLEKAFDTFLGKGSFAKIYEQTPSILFLINYLSQLTNGLADEINSLNENESNVKYLTKVNK